MKKYIIVVLVVLITITLTNCTQPIESNDELQAPSNFTLEQIYCNCIQLYCNCIQLNWQDNSSAEDGFQIDRKIGENDWEENYQILSENSTTYIDSELVAIDNYSYRLTAYSNDDISDTVEANIDFFYDDVSYLYPESYSFFGGIYLSLLEPYEYEVTLKDSNGNIVLRDYEVWFKFISKPEGTNINNIIYNISDSISVQSVDGIASVILYAGNQSGGASIKTYTYNSSNEEISIIRSNIVVYGSTPEVIELSISGIDSGVDVGNGNWEIEVMAFLTDNQGNPAYYGAAVYFSLPDNPEWATIYAPAYVGNENANGDSLSGAAFTSLVYNGTHINDTLFIMAETEYCSETEEFNMPLQFPTLQAFAIPQYLEWNHYNPDADSLIAIISVSLKDGQNNPIDNQQIHFTSTLGVPIDMGTDNDNNPFTENTGIVWGQHGRIGKEWKFYKYECPPPSRHLPGTIQGIFLITVPGTSIAVEFSITLYRYPGY